MVLNSDWMNNPNAPFSTDGQDLLVGQGDSSGRHAVIRGTRNDARLETLGRWIIPTGGAFLFAPSLSLLRTL
jgi:hypothetical protein